MLRRILPLLLLALVGCATVKPGLPEAPAGADLTVDRPIPCPGGVLYLHVFDTNPATEALVAVVGEATAGHDHKPPFLVVVGDDAGTATFYVRRNGTVKTYSRQEFAATFGGVGGEAACAIFETLSL